MICVFFSLRGVLVVSLLGDDDTFQSDLMSNATFSEVGAKHVEQSRQKGLDNLLLQMVHAPCRNSRQTTPETETIGLSRIPHRPISSEI
jgi:hypothetical protein